MEGCGAATAFAEIGHDFLAPLPPQSTAASSVPIGDSLTRNTHQPCQQYQLEQHQHQQHTNLADFADLDLAELAGVHQPIQLLHRPVYHQHPALSSASFPTELTGQQALQHQRASSQSAQSVASISHAASRAGPQTPGQQQTLGPCSPGPVAPHSRHAAVAAAHILSYPNFLRGSTQSDVASKTLQSTDQLAASQSLAHHRLLHPDPHRQLQIRQLARLHQGLSSPTRSPLQLGHSTFSAPTSISSDHYLFLRPSSCASSISSPTSGSRQQSIFAHYPVQSHYLSLGAVSAPPSAQRSLSMAAPFDGQVDELARMQELSNNWEPEATVRGSLLQKFSILCIHGKADVNFLGTSG